MTTPVLLEERDGDILLLTLNRPSSYNAINPALRNALVAALGEAAATGARAVVLQGAGRGFSAGIDLKESDAPRGTDLMRYMNASSQALVRAVLGCPLPVVAAVHGTCAGLALTMALGADHCVAATDARLFAPFLKMGLVPDGALTYLLPRLAGTVLARRLLLSGEMTAVEAAASGLIAETVPLGELRAVARERAAAFAALPREAFAYTKSLLHRSFDLDLEGVLFEERAGQALLSTSMEYSPAPPGKSND